MVGFLTLFSFANVHKICEQTKENTENLKKCRFFTFFLVSMKEND